MLFKKDLIDLGIIESSRKHDVVFEYLGDKEIVKMESSCGCSVPKFDRDSGLLRVVYSPSKVPVHLKDRGEYSTRKHVVVMYDDGSSDVIHFRAIVKDVL